MHIVSRYGLSCGSKIERPIINTKFFPIPFGKYITFNAASTNMPAKNYAYWADVLAIITPELTKNGISVIQLGDASEPQFGGVHRYNGQTSMAQSCYLVQNAMMHLGVDSMLVHAADAFNTKICALYSVSGPETCGPYFSDSSNLVLLKPNFKENESYYYNPQAPNMANTIKVEDICAGVGKLLDISFPKIKTLFVSPNYPSTVIELIPDGLVLAPNQFQGASVVIRHDLGGDENVIYQQLQHRRCLILTDKGLQIPVLNQLKPNIERIVYLINNLSESGGAAQKDIDFVKEVFLSGIPVTVVTDLEEDKIGGLKLDLSEHSVVVRRPRGKRPENITVTEKTWARSSKIICGKSNTFSSYSNYLKNIPIQNNSNLFKLADDENLWAETGEFLFVFDKE